MIALCPTPGAGLQQILHGIIKASAINSPLLQAASKQFSTLPFTALSIGRLLHSAATIACAKNNASFFANSFSFASLLLVVLDTLRKILLPNLAQPCPGIYHPAGKPLFSQTFESI
ncbi:hypothetical protein [Pseudocnuella soli]|uniref:hypothetical protein n=1 Tax=Pseudocnuella soli TaxID=2502779 RepID=UPI001048CB57|nr:hypothetical protein [Pseudocnuella soli]